MARVHVRRDPSAGPAHARNRGAAAAAGDLLCFCDADDQVATGWLRAHVAAARGHDLASGALDLENLNNAEARTWRSRPASDADGSAPHFATSSNLAIWAKAFWTLGGFDESLRTGEDIDLSARADAAGLSRGHVGDAVVSYRLRTTLTGLARQAYLTKRTESILGIRAGSRPPLKASGSRLARGIVRLPYLALPGRRGIPVRLIAGALGSSATLRHQDPGPRLADPPERQPDMVDLSVVLPTFNGAGTIRNQLDAFANQEVDGTWEMLVVDNGSTDGTEAIARSYADRLPIRVISAPDLHNLSYVRNVGARHAVGRSLVFVDDDDEVAPGYLAAMARALDEHKLCVPRFEHELLTSDAGHASHFATAGLPTLFGVTIAPGACAVVRSVWEELDGNDERWGRTGEDFDFAFRARRGLGVEPTFVPSAVYHYRARSGARAIYRQSFRYAEAHVLLYREHGRALGACRDPLSRVAKQWLWLALHVLDLGRAGRTEHWLRLAGRRVGRLEGSVRYRTFYP